MKIKDLCKKNTRYFIDNQVGKLKFNEVFSLKIALENRLISRV